MRKSVEVLKGVGFRVAELAKKAAAGAVVSSAVVGLASAQTTGMDVSGVVSTIAEGVTALGLIGVAWVGYVYLKKAWNKL